MPDPDGHRLRPLRWWDLGQVLALERAVFPDPWSAEMFWSELAGVPATRHYLVAEDGEGLTGYAGLFAAGHQADVQTIATAPRARGTGLGARLLQSLLDEAARRSCSEVLLDVRADNAPAIALYERFGFERVSVRRGYYRAAPGKAPTVDGLVLRRRL